MIVCVLDLDETLGYFDKNVFHVRPKVDFLVDFLRFSQIDFILWSLGSDSYVTRVVNGYLPEVAQYAYKMFGRSECSTSCELYNYKKCSEHIRIMYERDILLIGVDDKAMENMDNGYDMRIAVKPYEETDNQDRELFKVVEEITKFGLTHTKQ